MVFSERAARLFDFIKRRKLNYQFTFPTNQPAVQEFLIDFFAFCRVNETCVVLDQNGKMDQERTLILEGRREAALRIIQHCELTTQQLYSLYTGKQFNMGDE